jgi:hypothetical protein
MAQLGWQGPVYVVSREDGALLMHAETEPTGAWAAAASGEPPGFDEVRALAGPMLACKADGTWIVSTWNWDFGTADVRASDCCVSTDAPLAPGLAPRRYADMAPGSFEVRGMLWRVSWPSEAPLTDDERAAHRRRRSSPNARIRL